MGGTFLLLTVIWLRVQAWWAVGVETPPTISLPLDATGFSPPAVFDSAIWLDQFLSFLHVRRPGLISATSRGNGISLNIHMPLTTELLSPVSSLDHGSPLLEFQRLPPPSIHPSRTIPLNLHDQAFVTGIIECDATLLDTGSDHAHDWQAWSGSPYLGWLAKYLSGHFQLPFAADRAYSSGPYYYEVPGSPLPLLLVVLLSIALLRLFYAAFLQGVSAPETESLEETYSVNPVEDGFIRELLANAARNQLEGSDDTSAAASATSDAAVNTEPDHSVLKLSVLVAFLRLSLARLSSQVRDSTETSAAYDAQIQQKDNEIAAKEQLLKQKGHEISTKEEVIESQDKIIHARDSELAYLEKKLKGYEGTPELREQHDDLKNLLKEAEAKEKKQGSLVASLRKGIDKLKEKRDDAQKELEKVQASQKTLQETVANQGKVIKAQKESAAELEKTRNDNAGLESSLKEKQSELEEACKSRDEAQKEAESQEKDYMSIVDDLNETNCGLQQKLDKQEEVIRRRTLSLSEMEQLKEKTANLQEIIDAQKASLDELIKDNGKLSDLSQTSIAAAASLAHSAASSSASAGGEPFASTIPVVSLSDFEGTVAPTASSPMVMPGFLDQGREQVQTGGLFKFEESHTGPRVNLSFLRDGGGHQTSPEPTTNAAHLAFPREGGGILFGAPLRNAEGIVTRPMTQKEREEWRRQRARAQQDAARDPTTPNPCPKGTTGTSAYSEGSGLATGPNGPEVPVEDKRDDGGATALDESNDVVEDKTEGQRQERLMVNLSQRRDETKEGAAEAKRATDVAERSEVGRKALMESKWAKK